MFRKNSILRVLCALITLAVFEPQAKADVTGYLGVDTSRINEGHGSGFYGISYHLVNGFGDKKVKIATDLPRNQAAYSGWYQDSISTTFTVSSGTTTDGVELWDEDMLFYEYLPCTFIMGLIGLWGDANGTPGNEFYNDEKTITVQ